MSIRLPVFALALAALAGGSAHAQDNLTLGRKINGILSDSGRIGESDDA